MSSQKNYDYEERLKFVLPSFYIIALGCVLFTLFARWLLEYKLELFTLKEPLWEILAPVLIPIIPIFIWIKPKCFVLRMAKKESKFSWYYARDKADVSFYYWLVAWIVYGLLISFSQVYFSQETGVLTKLNSVDEINMAEQTRYYTFRDFSILPNSGRSKTEFHYDSGRRNHASKFTISDYVVFPVVSENPSTAQHYWLGLYYTQEQKEEMNPGGKRTHRKRLLEK